MPTLQPRIEVHIHQAAARQVRAGIGLIHKDKPRGIDAQARQLPPVVSPAARWSDQRVPDVDSPEASAPHALVIDDLLMLRQVPPRYLAGGVAVGTTLASVLRRYDQVGLRTKPSKVRDYDAVQDLLGHTLDHNVLRGSCSWYAAIRADVLRAIRCGWARPREVERLVGKITNVFLLHRPSLALFNAVYAFCHTEWPERPRRLWPSVQ